MVALDMNGFEVIDISGDAGIRAFGRDLPSLFNHAAAGMYALITDPASVRPTEVRNITAERDSLEGLLVAWLNELIFLFDAYGFIGRKITVHEFTPKGRLSGVTGRYTIRADVAGETFAPDRHKGGLLLKAATYHRMHVKKEEGRWQADIIFDI
jgi:SHS2 domain-containing protein